MELGEAILTNKKGAKDISKLVKTFYFSLAAIILVISAYSVTAADRKPAINCDTSISNQTQCSLKLPENYNQTIERTKWTIEDGNISERTNKSVKIENRTVNTTIKAETVIGNQTYNLGRQLLAEKTRDTGSVDEKSDREENINLGNFTDKKNNSNIRNKTNEEIRKPPKDSFNLTSVNVSCPEKLNASETFYCSVDIAKNTSSELETEWFSDELELKRQEKFKAEFETGEESRTVLVGYRVNSSTTEVTSTEKVVIEESRSIQPPVKRPGKEEKIEELNKTIEEKNRTIEKLRNRVKRLKEELNNAKSNRTVDNPNDQSEENQEPMENKSEIVQQPVEPKNSTETKPGNETDNSNNQSKGAGDEETQTGNTLVDIISLIFR